jgi:acetyl esterase/lipase
MWTKDMPTWTRLALLVGAITLMGGATASASTAPITEIRYGPSPSEQLAVYDPPNPVATVVLVHGGGWVHQSSTSKPALGQEASALQSAGFAVFDVNYDQATETQRAFPLEVEDIVAATRFAIAHAAEYGGDPNNVVLIGNSAGGQLVMRAAAILGTHVRGVVSLSGPTNFTTLVGDVQEGLITYSAFITDIDWALGCRARVPGSCDERYERYWSPIFNISTTPAWLLFSAEIDLVPESQSQEMYDALRAAGASATLTVVPGKGHAVTYWSTIERQVITFIREH